MHKSFNVTEMDCGCSTDYTCAYGESLMSLFWGIYDSRVALTYPQALYIAADLLQKIMAHDRSIRSYVPEGRHE